MIRSRYFVSLYFGPLAMVLLAGVLGCSTGPSMGTVNGTVTLDGKPLADGTINFIPTAEAAAPGGAAPAAEASPVVGTTIHDGKFTVEVPLGKMRVEIHANKVVGQHRAYDTADSPLVPIVVEVIPTQYNANSTLTIDVQRGSQDVPYDLKSKP